MKDIVIFVGGNPMIFIDDEFFGIELYTGQKLKKEVGYIVNGDTTVKIYRGKYKKDSTLPGWYMKDNDIYEIKPDKKDTKYHISNITEWNIDKIFNTVSENEEDFIQPTDVEVINNNAEVYTPTIKPEDDFLKYLVKRIIIEKQINLKNYKGRFSNHYALTNMKSGLNRSTKMTVTNFKVWCEILGIDWTITVKDSGDDKISPLPEPITIESGEF